MTGRLPAPLAWVVSVATTPSKKHVELRRKLLGVLVGTALHVASPGRRSLACAGADWPLSGRYS